MLRTTLQKECLQAEITTEEAFKQCFLKYQQTCAAYNDLKKLNRELSKKLEAYEQEQGPKYPC